VSAAIAPHRAAALTWLAAPALDREDAHVGSLADDRPRDWTALAIGFVVSGVVAFIADRIEIRDRMSSVLNVVN
jgi:hypothetical protein